MRHPHLEIAFSRRLDSCTRPKVGLRRVEAGKFFGTNEDLGEHGAVEPTGVGVAQRWVVAAQDVGAAGQGVFGGVAEAKVGFAVDDARVEQVGEEAVEGDLAQADDDADFRQGFNFAGEEGSAVAYLLRGRLVVGRGAADDGRDPGVTELETVVLRDALGLIGEADVVEDGVHEIAGAVAGEDAAGAVGAVRSGGQAEDVDAGGGVSEAGDGTAPVGLVLIGAAFGAGDALAIGAQAGALLAGGDVLVELLQNGGGSLYGGACHSLP